MTSQFTLLALAMASVVSAQNKTSSAASSPSAAAAAAAAALKKKAAILNQDFYNYIFIILSALIVAMTIWRVTIEATKYVRTLTCLNNETQGYFTRPSKRFASIKKHILYAPVFSKRHNREIQLSSAVNVGTLPTRLQLAFLAGIFGTNIAFCVVSISWSAPLATVTQQLRNRTGILAVVNMVWMDSWN